MNKTWFISDTHFGHTNIIRYCGRPYISQVDMDEDLIRRWNAVVAPEDTVYHLGDFAFGPPAKQPGWVDAIRKRLRGHIILIRGSHDKSTEWLHRCGFDEVYDSLFWRDLSSPLSTNYLLVHEPPLDDSVPTLCGHVHNKWCRIGQVYNLSVENWNYQPVSIETILNAPEDSRYFKCSHCGAQLDRLTDRKNLTHLKGLCI